MMLSIPVDWTHTQTYKKFTGSPPTLRDLDAPMRPNSASRNSRSDLDSENYQHFDVIQSPKHTNKPVSKAMPTQNLSAASATATNTSTPTAPTPTPTPTMRQQQAYYKSQYATYKKDGKIQVSSIGTYQGRSAKSTNGCTVISALVVAQHMQDTQPFTTVSNETIEHVIDVQCGPILRAIRNKLRLGYQSLIVPSDVHDHLMDKQILQQQHFTGVTGGNILDQQHVQEFLKLLSDTTSNTQQGTTKVGATLFFREHVISIIKSVDPHTKKSYWNLIDSLPGMVRKGKRMATNTRCTDLDSLEVVLMTYASRKFTAANCTYIDRNPWNDRMAYSDLRVFQGFAWSSVIPAPVPPLQNEPAASDDANDKEHDDTEQAALEPQPTFVTPPPSPISTQQIHSTSWIPTNAVVIILDDDDDDDDDDNAVPAALELQPTLQAPLPSPHTTQPIHSTLPIPTNAVVIILDDDDDDNAEQAVLEPQLTFVSPHTSPTSTQQIHSSLRIPADDVVIILDDDDEDNDDAVPAVLEPQPTLVSPPPSLSSSQQMDDNEHDEEVAQGSQLTFFPPPPPPLPPISIRRSPRLAFLERVSYVGMC